MYVVTVIPFSKGLSSEVLTYWSAKEVPIGKIVSVPLRKKTVDALVFSCEGATHAKSMIKEADFTLKKIVRVKGPSFWNTEFIRTAEELREYFVASTGNIILSMVPTIFFENFDKLKKIKKGEERPSKKITNEKEIYQAPLEDRLSSYKTLIRESFAKKKSIFFVLPTSPDIHFFAENLGKGIEEYIYIFDGSLSKKETLAKYNSLIAESHPVIIFATGSYLFIPRDDLDTYIVECESSEAYIQMKRPYIDTRIFTEKLCKIKHAKFILGDTLLRIETLWRAREGELSEFSPVTFRITSEIDIDIIDMKEDEEGNKKPFEILSPKLLEMISESIRKDEKLFLFTLRKGLAPLTVCNDCKTPVFCDSCNAPLVLYTKENNGDIERIFACNRCRESKDPNMVCPACKSWNLTALGVGIDLVAGILAEKFPDLKIFTFDKTKIKNADDAESVIERFWNTKNSILIGTELSFFYLQNKVDRSAIVSLDSLFSIPYFRINEKILRILIKVSSITKEYMLIQTRNSSEPVLSQFKNKNFLSFYREEIRERRHYDYPPFSVIIKTRVRIKKEKKPDEKKRLEELFDGFNISIGSRKTKDRRYIELIMILKCARIKWQTESVDKDLHSRLRSLGPEYSIEIDPSDPY